MKLSKMLSRATCLIAVALPASSLFAQTQASSVILPKYCQLEVMDLVNGSDIYALNVEQAINPVGPGSAVMSTTSKNGIQVARIELQIDRSASATAPQAIVNAVVYSNKLIIAHVLTRIGAGNGFTLESPQLNQANGALSAPGKMDLLATLRCAF